MPRMPKWFPSVIVAALLALAWCAPARAQDETRDDFWPEVDGYKGLGESMRLMLMASADRSAEADYHEATVGVLFDYFAKPLVREWLHEHPDADKKHYLTFRTGYRYSWDIDDAPGGYTENRILVEGTGRAAVRHFFALNRSRVEWRDVNDTWSWRYRNRTRVEADIPMGKRAATPYLMAEFFYDSRYDEWNRQLYYVGVDWPIHRKAVLDTYYARQNDSRSKVAHENIAGLTLRLFF
jgi:hypothetical protein